MLKVQANQRVGKFSRMSNLEKPQQKNLVLMRAQSKIGFLDWVKEARDFSVIDEIVSGKMSQKTLQEHFTEFEKWRDGKIIQVSDFRQQKVIVSQKAEIAKLKKQVAEQKQNVSNLKKQNESLQKIQSQRYTDEEVQALVNESKVENQHLKSQLSGLIVKLNDLFSDIEEYKVTIANLNRKIQNQREQLAESQKYIVRAKGEIKFLEDKISEKKSSIVDLQQRIEQTEAGLRKLEILKSTSIFDALMAFTEQSDQIKELRQENSMLEQRNSSLRDKIVRSEKNTPRPQVNPTRPRPVIKGSEEKYSAENDFLLKMQQEYTEAELEILKDQKVIVYCGAPGTIERNLKTLKVDVEIVIVSGGKLKTVRSKARSNRSFVFYDSLHSHAINNILASKNITAYKIRDGDSATNIVAKMIGILKKEYTK